ESILSHNITDIRHRPGIENPVADGLSRRWQSRKRTDDDGSSWSVLADWEANKSIVNDILSVTPIDRPETPPRDADLESKFRGDVFFEPIIRHLLGLDAGANIAERRRAMHRSQGFTIQDGKLWKAAAKTSDRVSRRQCIPRADGFEFALGVHRSIGHFRSVDSLKLHIHETTFWPGMDVD
ncbi:hypothetical protein FIBSPDRAFT_673023, partial [Athelia psychrophila]